MIRKIGLSLFITGICFGLIAGIVLWNMLVAGKIDELYKRNLFLETSLEDYKTKYERLNDSKPDKEQTLKDIVIKIELQNELERLNLEKAVKQKYDVLLGKKTNEIDLELAIQVVDKRLFRTDKYQYQLIVERIALSSSLILWLSVKEIRPIDLE